MNQVEEKLMKLYWKLWTSADFENDFQENWWAVYQKLQMGDHYSIPPQVVEMCFQYLINWGKRRLKAFFFLWRVASLRRATKIPLYHALRILSSEICEKTAQSCIPKLVQNYLLIFLKTFAIIYLQGKERGKESHGSTAVPKRYKNSKKIFFSF